MHLSRSSGNIADSVFSPHGSAVSDLDLQTLDLLRELHALRVGQRAALVVDVANVEDLAHEVDD